MKLLSLLIMFTLLLTACANKIPLPPEDYYIKNPGDTFLIMIPKGFFDNHNNYLTKEEYQKYKDRIYEEFLKQKTEDVTDFLETKL